MTIIPNEESNFLSKKFPGIWHKIEKEAIKQQNHDIASDCYIPSGIITSILCTDYKLNILEAQNYVPAITSVASWRFNKRIYSFDRSVAEEIMKSYNHESAIPVEIFEQMPYNCLYLEVKNTPLSAFITVDMDTDGNKALLFYAPTSKRTASLSLKSKSIAECIKDEKNQLMKFLDLNRQKIELSNIGITKENIQIQYQKELSDKLNFLGMLLPLVLYLCAENAEIEYNGTSVNKDSFPSPSVNSYSNVNSKPTKPKRMDVGIKLGRTIRFYKNDNAETQKSAKKSVSHIGTDKRIHLQKSPHVRKGHYHHFWTGSTKDNTRSLKLKWVAPSFVNMSNIDNIPIIKHNIK